MAIIYSYPTVAPTTDDLILGTDINQADKPTKNFTIASIITLVNAGSSGLGAVIKLDPSAKDPIAPFANQSATDFLNISGTGTISFPGLVSTTITNAGAINTATLTASGLIDAATFQTTAGTATWTGETLAGFASITTTGITLNGTVGGTALVQTMPSVAGGSTTKIVSEKGIIDYIVGSPADSDSLAEVLNVGNETQGAVAVVLVGGGTGYTPGIAIAATTGGTGAADLTVNINVSAGGVIGSISIADPGTGYTNADTITVTGGNNDATATLTVVSNDIAVSAGDDITFTDSSKILLGTGADGEIYHSGANLLIYNNTGEIRIENQTLATGMLLKTISATADITMASGRDIIFQSDGVAQRLKIADDGLGWNQLEVGSGDTLALANHVRVWQQAGAGSSPVIRPPYSFMGNTNTGMYDASTTGPTDEGVGLTVNGVGLYQFKTLGFTSTAPFTNSISYTTSTTTGLALMTRFILSTDFTGPETTAIQEFPNDTMIPTNLAVKLYADEVAGSKTLNYEGDSTTAVAGVATGNSGVASTTITIVANAAILPGMTITGALVTTSNAKVLTNVGSTLTFDKAVAITGVSAATAVSFGQAFAMNLDTDTLDISGTTDQIATIATAVTANKAEINVALTDDVTIPGTMTADTFETTATTATWSTTIMGGFTSIESDLFVGDASAALIPPIPPWPLLSPANVQFQGNASSANILKLPGTISITTAVGVLLGPTAAGVTYTNGGIISLVSELLSSTVTGKTLGGLVVPATGSSITTSDSILTGFGKLQAQHNTATTGLRFMGTWNAATNAPTLLWGSGQLAAGTNSTDGTTLTDASKNFGSGGLGVIAGDRVYNQRGDFTTVDTTPSATSTTLTLVADIFLTPGQTYSVDDTADGSATPPTANLPQGEYYVVSVEGTTSLNGIVDWKVGDWVMSAATNVWEKQDNTGVDGNISENVVAKGSATPGTIVDSTITATAALITLGDASNLGGAAGDAIHSVGIHTIDEQLILKKGLGHGSTPDYGATDQALFSGGSAAAEPVWTDVTWNLSDDASTPVVSAILNAATATFASGTGIVTAQSGGTLTTNIRYVDSVPATPTYDNAILAATLATDPILTTDQIWFNDVATAAAPSVTINTIKKANISNLPFDNYVDWVLSDNESTPNTTSITTGATAKFAGGLKITTGESSGTLTIDHDLQGNTPATTTAAPAFGASFTAISAVAVDTTGHLTGQTVKTVTIPANPDFVPSTASVGTHGLVPAPAANTHGGTYFLNGDGSFSVPPDLKGIETVNTTSPIGGGGSTATVTITHDNVLTDAGGTAASYTSADITVDAKGHITAASNGTGTYSFTGSVAYTGTTPLPLFTLKKATTGQLIFDVYLTSGTTSGTVRKYVVAHPSNTTPVWNQVIALEGTPNFTVAFTNATTSATGDSVLCTITPTATQTVSYTVQVGYDSVNAVTIA